MADEVKQLRTEIHELKAEKNKYKSELDKMRLAQEVRNNSYWYNKWRI